MNINQAKAMAGISWPVNTKAGIDRAERHCMRQIILARKAGDDNRAKVLSNAREVFKARQRRGNTCRNCGTVISASATLCRACLRPKALPLPAGLNNTATARRKRGVKRASIPIGEDLAGIGYWATPVQKVVRRWLHRKISQREIEDTFISVACSVLMLHSKAEGEFILQINELHFLQLGLDLARAINSILADKSKPAAWLLLLPKVHVGSDGGMASWLEITAQIQQQSGREFKPGAVKKAAERMRLI